MTQDTQTVLATVEVPSQEALMALYGSFDENMQVLEAECGVRLRVNDRELTVEGENDHVQVAVAVLEKMLEMIARKEPIDKSRVRYAISLAREGQAELISEMMGDVVLVTHRGKQIKCRTVGQKKYIDAIRKNSVVVAVGPAGTGKTYLAVAMAITAFKNKENPCTCPPEFPVCVCGKKPEGRVISKKPILPSEEELEANSRSKSAKLRVFEKI